MILELSERELGAVLTGLRLWQAQLTGAMPITSPCTDIRLGDFYLTESGDRRVLLSAAEIDALCERINP